MILTDMKTKTLSICTALFFAIGANSSADEQHGVSVVVARRTTDRTAIKGESDTTKLKQGLKLELKNLRLKALPEGELQWTVLVKKRWEGFTSYEGKETLKPLKSQQTVELFVGDFAVSTTRSSEGISKEKVEYQIVVRHEGKETYRFATDADFNTLAKIATPAEPKVDVAAGDGKIAEVDPKKMPVDPKMVPDPTKKGMPPAPGGNPPPTTPGKPALADEPKVNVPPVDFFNLRGK